MSQGTRPRRDDLGRPHSSWTMLFLRSQPNLFNLKCHKRLVKIENFQNWNVLNGQGTKTNVKDIKINWI